VPSVHVHTAVGGGVGDVGMDPAATGDAEGALTAIGEAGRVSPGPPGLLNPVPAQRARLLLAQGDLAAAARWTAESGLIGDDDAGIHANPATWCWLG
jgi:LuxR family maltose regulon positive regulatory protein